MTQDTALKSRDQNNSDRTPLILTFHPVAKRIAARNNFNILFLDDSTNRIHMASFDSIQTRPKSTLRPNTTHSDRDVKHVIMFYLPIVLRDRMENTTRSQIILRTCLRISSTLSCPPNAISFTLVKPRDAWQIVSLNI